MAPRHNLSHAAQVVQANQRAASDANTSRPWKLAATPSGVRGAFATHAGIHPRNPDMSARNRLHLGREQVRARPYPERGCLVHENHAHPGRITLKREFHLSGVEDVCAIIGKQQDGRAGIPSAHPRRPGAAVPVTRSPP